MALHYARREFRGGLRVADSLMKQKIKFGLLRLLGWAEKGVCMVPEHSRFL